MPLDLGGRNFRHSHQRTAALGAVTALDEQDQTTPAKPGEAEVALLDAVPYLAANLADAPPALLRTLFEVTDLGVRMDADGDHALISVRLPGDRMTEIVTAVDMIADAADDQQKRLIRENQALMRMLLVRLRDSLSNPGTPLKRLFAALSRGSDFSTQLVEGQVEPPAVAQAGATDPSTVQLKVKENRRWVNRHG
jgi:hypothetical protein